MKLLNTKSQILNSDIILFKVQKKKKKKNINIRVSKTSNDEIMILSKCAICSISRFIQKQETSKLLSNLGRKTPLSKIPLLGDILF